MFKYEITPEIGSVKVWEDNELVGKFYYVQNAFDWDIFDEFANVNDMPVATVATQEAVWLWVHAIDPESFRDERN